MVFTLSYKFVFTIPGSTILTATLRVLELVLERLTDAFDGPFRAVVNRLIRKCDLACNRRNIDDRSTPSLSEVRQDPFDYVDRPDDICLNEFGQGLVGS